VGALTLYVPDRFWGSAIPSVRGLFEDISPLHEFLSHIGEIQFETEVVWPENPREI
jgi:hypothetical protein